MLAQTHELTGDQFQEIILEEYGPAGEQLGFDASEVVAAFAPDPERAEQSYAELDVQGIRFSSYRHQVGVLDEQDRSRGGCELSEDVTGEKILHKAVTMEAKHLLAQTGNVGGKSGILATREELEAIGPKGRRELFAQHAEAHDINPYTNVVATDIGTYGPDMDAIAEALVPEYGQYAGAAASGASAKYGGEPELHAPRTGLGASIVLDRYLHSIADSNPRVAEAIEGGRPLRVLIQGLGKAGAHFLNTMPDYIQPAGALEQHGSIVVPDGYMDRAQLLAAARATKLNESSRSDFNNARWMPPEARAAFWASNGIDILAPAFDRNQIDEQDVFTFAQDGTVIASIANGPITPEGLEAAAYLQLDELPDAVTNVGGTISSQGIADKIMGKPGWTPASYERSWRAAVTRVADTTIETRAKLSAEIGQFVPLDRAANLIVVQRAVQRLRQLKG